MIATAGRCPGARHRRTGDARRPRGVRGAGRPDQRPDVRERALQGALITAWRDLPTLRDPDRFEAWVRKLVVHACYAEARRRNTWAVNVRILPVDGPAGPDEIVSVADRDTLDRAFRRLTVEQRAVFVLHHHLGLPLVEIAETLGVPAGTARSRLHYATRTLRAAIEADAAPAIPEGRMA
jgi:RNA polymerase sigma-70 factor, ECF subfamily